MQVAVGVIRGRSLGVELVSWPAEIAEFWGLDSPLTD